MAKISKNNVKKGIMSELIVVPTNSVKISLKWWEYI